MTTAVLLVEDEMMLAMLVRDILAEAGYRVLPASRLGQGSEIAAREPVDAAVLDVNVAGEQVFPLARELARRGIPFLFASAYGANGIPAEFSRAPVLQKPYMPEALLDAMRALLAGDGDAATPPRLQDRVS